MDIFEILYKYFGYQNFRHGQEQLVNAVLDNKDTLGIMPTGAGKSMCYQVPAMVFSGITIVVSPLISLMQDQVMTLTQSGIPAAYINSSLNPRQMYEVMENAYNGMYKLIYVAPERLLTPNFLQFATSSEISMVCVDEAHCISKWGQDFRQSYLDIPVFINKLSKRPVIAAFTATATIKVREDIVLMLNLKNPEILITGFDRENLYFEVINTKDKDDALLKILSQRKNECGIIYCLSRRLTEEVCEFLNNNNIKSAFYHAGLSDDIRKKNQNDFLRDKYDVMVATNAFGMGIDKSNVSFVVHYNMPRDIESYYQEAGRAGRDGNLAKCTLLYSAKDVRLNEWLIDHSYDDSDLDEKTIKELKSVEYKRLRDMIFYCTTSECLRAYILKYFGEKPSGYCGYCSNCDTNFEEIDITVEAQKILSCVYRLKERFGTVMVIDVLRGSKNEKVLSMGFDKLSTYNISEKTVTELRGIIDYLLEKEYLAQSEGEFKVLLLTKKSSDVLKGRVKLVTKVVIEKKKNKNTSTSANAVENEDLFNILKKLRMDIAKVQNVPAFVIFSDKTLIEMSDKIPKNLDEFSGISGVGQAKLERYGERFVKAINAYCDEN